MKLACSIDNLLEFEGLASGKLALSLDTESLMFIDEFGGMTHNIIRTIGVISSLVENNKQIVVLNRRVVRLC